MALPPVNSNATLWSKVLKAGRSLALGFLLIRPQILLHSRLFHLESRFSMSHRFSPRPHIVLLSGLLLSTLWGCGGPAAPKREYADVTGKVTYKNQPVPKGQVIFQPATGAAVTGDLKSDGTYSMKGVIGPNTVTIISRDDMGATDANKPETRMMPKSHIPEIYGTPGSNLKFDVKAGTNTANFDLQ
jgi:hypothetical protein